MFFHQRAPLQVAHERCKWRHERCVSVVAGTNATPVSLPTPSHSCALAFAPGEPLTQEICKELCSETNSGSLLLVVVLGHSPTPQHPTTSSSGILPGHPGRCYFPPGNSSRSFLIQETDNHLITAIVSSHPYIWGEGFPSCSDCLTNGSLLLSDVMLPLAPG